MALSRTESTAMHWLVWVVCVALLIAIIEAAPATKDRFETGLYRAKLVRVVDGDTIRCDVEICEPLHLTVRDWPVRVADIQAPELHVDGVANQAGVDSKNFASKWLDGKSLVIKTKRRLDPHDRLVAWVFDESTGASFGAESVRAAQSREWVLP